MIRHRQDIEHTGWQPNCCWRKFNNGFPTLYDGVIEVEFSEMMPQLDRHASKWFSIAGKGARIWTVLLIKMYAEDDKQQSWHYESSRIYRRSHTHDLRKIVTIYAPLLKGVPLVLRGAKSPSPLLTVEVKIARSQLPKKSGEARRRRSPVQKP